MSNIKQNLLFIITFGILITLANLVGASIAAIIGIAEGWGMFIINLIIAIVLVKYNE